MSSDNYYRQFEREMDVLGRRYGLSRVFNDFLTVSMCSVHQTNIASRLKEKDPENEALYMDTIKPYSRNELSQFGKLLAYLQLCVYQEPYSDLLGQYFTEHITKGHNGQFFTPTSVSMLMSQLTASEEPPKGKRVYDPACGSGRLLLEFAKAAPANFFYANDVSLTCAKMTSLNFMFNGLRGEVACMNTLSMEWGSGWKVNTPVLGIVPIEKKSSRIWSAPPEPQSEPQQLTLF
ncbi:MAG: N-6 DNA methylase [Bacteroidota bacterium]